MGRLAAESQLAEHPLVLLEVGVAGGQQLVAGEYRVGAGQEQQPLLGGREGHTPGGESDHRSGHEDACGGDGTCHVHGCYRVGVPVVVEWGPFHRDCNGDDESMKWEGADF